MNDRKTVVVTGATRNTGLAVVRKFLSEGWNVVLTSRERQNAESTASDLQCEYPDSLVLGYELELDNMNGIRDLFTEVGNKLGSIDAFVANAADLAVGLSILNTTPEDYDRVMNCNLKGNYFCCQQAARWMKQGGSIVIVSSIHANGSIWGRALYSTSKAGLNALVRCIAVELGHLGIRANSLIAGAIWSHRWDEQAPEITAARRAQYPSGRESKPDEIAASVYFLCTDDAKTITGTEMTVDSGLTVCLLPYQNQKKEEWPENW